MFCTISVKPMYCSDTSIADVPKVHQGTKHEEQAKFKMKGIPATDELRNKQEPDDGTFL